MNRRSNAFMKMSKHITLLKILTVILLIFQINSFAQTTVQYIYDDNGRLRAITYPNGEAAVYEYDAEGNILSIRREQNSTLSILYFSPNRGEIGESIQIIGTGFSANVAENTVKFNGVTATVQAASLTQLNVTVPVGATTGKISITNSIGTAISSNDFSVIETPVILDFNPKLGKWGDEVSISGDKFATVAGDNQIEFNGTSATVSTATTTTITTEVPDLATSGKIKIVNQAGEDLSDEDFYVVPNDIETADVFHTSRLVYNEEQDVTFNQPNKVAMLIIDGVAGQKISIDVTVPTSSFGSLILPLDLSIKNPNGSTLVQPTSMDSTQRGLFLEPFILPVTGTYTILLDKTQYPSGGGTANIAVYDVPPDATGIINLDGSNVEIANTIPGQNARLTFDGNAGQKVNILGEVLQVGNIADISILNPDGSTLFGPVFSSNSTIFGNSPAFAENITLPADGIYSIFINQFNNGVFASDVKLNTPPADVAATITADGSETTITTTEPGQNAEVTFNGSVGQKISLKLTNSNGIFNNYITIERPNGTTIVNNQFTGSTYFLDATTLTQNGTYKIKLNPPDSGIGTMKLNLYTVPPDVIATATIAGPAVTFATTVPGQNAQVTFEGQENQKVNIKISDYSYFSFAAIKDPNGNTITQPAMTGADLLIEDITLSIDGTYSISFNPSGESIGNTTVQIFDAEPLTITETITVGGPSLNLDFAIPFQKAEVSFSGTAGTSLQLAITNNTVSNSKLSVLRPDGTTFISNQTIVPTTPGVVLSNLPVTGVYKIVINPESENTGQMTLALNTVTDVTTSITVNGSPTTVNLTQGQNAKITFNGTSGQRTFIKLDNSAISNSQVTIKQPDGTTLTTKFMGFSGAGIDALNLPATGTYEILVEPSGTASGSFRVSASTTATIVFDEYEIKQLFLAANQTSITTFEGGTDADFNLLLSNPGASLNGEVKVFTPDGNLWITTTVFDGIFFEVLPATGTYRIEVTPNNGAIGEIEMSLVSFGGSEEE